MKIFSAAINQHDHNTYDGIWHNQLERHTRFKRNLWKGCYDHFFHEIAKPHIYNNDIFAFTLTAGGIEHRTGNWKEHPYDKVLRKYKKTFNVYKDNWDWLEDYVLMDNIYYIDHHQSHAIYAFLCSKFDESDILAIDGGGNSKLTAFFDKTGKMHNLSYILPLGWLWGLSSKIAGLGGGEAAGKTMGLSSYGKFNQKYYDYLEICIGEYQRRRERFYEWEVLNNDILPMDIAYTMQQFTLDKIEQVLLPYKTSDNICLAGGVAYNGYMNELLTKYYKNVFVPPAVGDEGQALGTYMHAEYMLNNTIHIPEVYAGKEYDIEDNEIDYHRIAKMIANGKIIGWFQGKSESGNRALGNRSILADPRLKNIKDMINHRIKKREDWRPFAPSVLEEHYQEYFDTSCPSPYMSRITYVKSDEIPGVTHIDNTARIQTVTKEQNEKFYNLISAFYDITGVPMVLNTSFNCQEPIVETPEDAINTFNNTELDAVIIGSKIIEK